MAKQGNKHENGNDKERILRETKTISDLINDLLDDDRFEEYTIAGVIGGLAGIILVALNGLEEENEIASKELRARLILYMADDKFIVTMQERQETEKLNVKLLKGLGLTKEAEMVENGKCPDCGEDVKIENFKDLRKRDDFSVTGLCEKCQDKLKKEDN